MNASFGSKKMIFFFFSHPKAEQAYLLLFTLFQKFCKPLRFLWLIPVTTATLWCYTRHCHCRAAKLSAMPLNKFFKHLFHFVSPPVLRTVFIKKSNTGLILSQIDPL